MHVGLVALLAHRHEGVVAAQKCGALVPFSSVHACIEVDPDALAGDSFECRHVPDVRPRGVLDRCHDAVVAAVVEHLSAQTGNLVSLVDFDAFRLGHDDPVSRQALSELGISQRAHVRDPLGQLPCWNGNVPGQAEGSTWRRAVDVGHVVLAQEALQLPLPLV